LRGSRPARFFVIAWTSFLFGIISFLLGTLGILPRNFTTTWAVQVGASLEVVLLSLGLADRINIMRRDLHVLNARLEENIANLRSALERANEATRLKGEFIATVSHELKTPLNAIVNVPDGLLEDFVSCPGAICRACGASFELESGESVAPSAPCPECGKPSALEVKTVSKYDGDVAKIADNLAFIRKSGAHLLSLVEDILDFSKLEVGGTRLRLESVSIAKALADSCEALANMAERRGVELIFPDVNLAKVVSGDGLKLRQIFMNLIGNAIKFSEAKGRVVVGFSDEVEHYVISVQDHGIGIALHDQGKIFDSFHQVDGGDTRKYGGTGLGLSISRRLVELHSGKIWVESAPGEGSTFFVRLPVSGPGQGGRGSSTAGAAA
jgi:signal transduction histidine kinase